MSPARTTVGTLALIFTHPACCAPPHRLYVCICLSVCACVCVCVCVWERERERERERVCQCVSVWVCVCLHFHIRIRHMQCVSLCLPPKFPDLHTLCLLRTVTSPARMRVCVGVCICIHTRHITFVSLCLYYDSPACVCVCVCVCECLCVCVCVCVCVGVCVLVCIYIHVHDTFCVSHNSPATCTSGLLCTFTLPACARAREWVCVRVYTHTNIYNHTYIYTQNTVCFPVPLPHTLFSLTHTRSRQQSRSLKVAGDLKSHTPTNHTHTNTHYCPQLCRCIWCKNVYIWYFHHRPQQSGEPQGRGKLV